MQKPPLERVPRQRRLRARPKRLVALQQVACEPRLEDLLWLLAQLLLLVRLPRQLGAWALVLIVFVARVVLQLGALLQQRLLDPPPRRARQTVQQLEREDRLEKSEKEPLRRAAQP